MTCIKKKSYVVKLRKCLFSTSMIDCHLLLNDASSTLLKHLFFMFKIYTDTTKIKHEPRY